MTKVNVSKLARAAGLSPTIVHNRLHNGWTMEEALTTPKFGRRAMPALMTPATETKVTEQPVPQKSSPSRMPMVVVYAAVLQATLSVCAVTAAWLFNAQH